MEYILRHRKIIAGFTLTAVFIVLLLAFLITVFSAACYAGSFEDNIMLTADSIGHSSGPAGAGLINTRNHEDLGGIAPAHLSYPDIQEKGSFIITIALLVLLFSVGVCLPISEHTPVNLRTRIDQ